MTARSIHDADVAAALEAVEVVSHVDYEWFGEAFGVPEHIARHAAPDLVREMLIQAIRWRLYANFFTTGRPTAVTHKGVAVSGPRGLSQDLVAANCGTGSVDLGWTFIGRDAGRWIVARKGLWLYPRPDEVVTDGSRDPSPGQLVAVRLPSDAPDMSPGFYMALGDRGFSADIPRALDRFYLNLRREGAVDFTRLATRHLNGMRLAFRAKVVDEPGGFDRCDSALLAFERCDRVEAGAAAIAIHAALADAVDAETPALTRRLAPGLAFAEDPESGESFGTQRCRLIAEAVVTAHERGVGDLAGRLELVRERFAREGTSLETPYLGPDSPGDLDDHSATRLEEEEPAACP